MIDIIEKAAAILLGSVLLGIGINGFLVPHHLLDGGTTGIALILHYYFGFPTGLVMFLLSIPLCIYAWVYEKQLFYRSFFGLILSSTMIDLFAPIRNNFLLPIFLSSLIGGTIIGIGLGLMLRYRSKYRGYRFICPIYIRHFFHKYRSCYFIDRRVNCIGRI